LTFSANQNQWQADDLINYLEELKNRVLELQQEDKYITSYQARKLETLCYDLIDLYITKPKNPTFSHNLSAHHLTCIRNIVFEIQDNDEQKAASLMKQLESKIHQKENHGTDRLYLTKTETSNKLKSIPEYRLQNGLVVNSAANFEIFEQTFIEKMESVAIANAAISSGLIAPRSSAIANAVNAGINGGTAALSLPGAGVANALVTVADEKNTKNQNQATNLARGSLIKWLPSIEVLSKNIISLFKAQIAAMVNSEDVKVFAELCKDRIYKALQNKSKLDWAKNMPKSGDDQKDLIRFCIAAIFIEKGTTHAVGIRENHYHLDGDKSYYGDSTLQSMIAHVGFIILDKSQPEIYMDRKSLHKNKNTKILKHDYLENYRFVDGSDDPEFYRWLANQIHRERQELPENKADHPKVILPSSSSSSASSSDASSVLLPDIDDNSTSNTVKPVASKEKKISNKLQFFLAKDSTKHVEDHLREMVSEVKRNRAIS
jgi:hypothetical protein